ncbi:YciI family protein [Sphingomonas fuzhouensis]|uniref:YciI family protein n=1 Tax=Sphingomonas fuzhouensis TaxID=3106033 RepID=UPI002AFFC0B2|nr:YciI family protein [Sphingomonas sp. SGZ-02]
MPYFIFHGYDRAGADRLRAVERQRHRDHLGSGAFGVSVVAGGMTLSGDEDAVTGSLLILSGETREAVVRFIDLDPYLRAGVFERYELDKWDWGIGAPGH